MSYTVFVQLLDAQGRLIAQSDALAGGERATHERLAQRRIHRGRAPAALQRDGASRPGAAHRWNVRRAQRRTSGGLAGRRGPLHAARRADGTLSRMPGDDCTRRPRRAVHLLQVAICASGRARQLVLSGGGVTSTERITCSAGICLQHNHATEKTSATHSLPGTPYGPHSGRIDQHFLQNTSITPVSRYS